MKPAASPSAFPRFLRAPILAASVFLLSWYVMVVAVSSSKPVAHGEMKKGGPGEAAEVRGGAEMLYGSKSDGDFYLPTSKSGRVIVPMAHTSESFGGSKSTMVQRPTIDVLTSKLFTDEHPGLLELPPAPASSNEVFKESNFTLARDPEAWPYLRWKPVAAPGSKTEAGGFQVPEFRLQSPAAP